MLINDPSLELSPYFFIIFEITARKKKNGSFKNELDERVKAEKRTSD